MIYSLVAYKSKKVGAFAVPFCTQFKHDELVEQITRSLVATTDDEREKMKEFDAYYLGEYDDKLGVITPCVPEFLVSCEDFLYGKEQEV